jgi:iron uptake system EfeUOB component EfeO/EfeM
VTSRSRGGAATTTSSSAAVHAALQPYTTGDTTYVAYTDLTKSDTQALSQAIDSLAEPLPKVSKQVVGS